MCAQQTLRPSGTLDSQVRVPDTVLCQDLEGEMVLLNLETGTYFGLDAVGTRTWCFIQEHGQLRMVLARLLEEFHVEEERCRADLLELTTTLCSHGLLKLVPPAGRTPSP